MEVTKSMKLLDGRYQTATQVKVLSPVILHTKEADSVHILEGRKSDFDKARRHSLFRGLSPRYDIEKKLQELGRPILLSRSRITAYNLKRRGSGKDRIGVGLIHSRGVAGIITCETKGHSKGLTLLRRGEGKHSADKELI